MVECIYSIVMNKKEKDEFEYICENPTATLGHFESLIVNMLLITKQFAAITQISRCSHFYRFNCSTAVCQQQACGCLTMA